MRWVKVRNGAGWHWEERGAGVLILSGGISAVSAVAWRSSLSVCGCFA